jgi:glyoxylase-like metal-dependent hydrolase (beta-lactamase superfamily II)
MRIHHLNCGCMCPVGGPIFDGVSRGLLGKLVCHCLLVETDNDGLVLIDTGFGVNDIEHRFPRLSMFYCALLDIRFKHELTAKAQIEELGFRCEDVRHVVLTHLDFDHAGGLDDFPHAAVHMMAQEAEAAQHRSGFVGRRRYRPQQWGDRSRWRTYPQPRGEPWFGFEAVRQLQGLPPEILLIPLAGHTRGHAGVAIDTGVGWLLNAGDAYFYHEEVGRPDRRCTPGLAWYQTMMEVDRKARLANQQRVRALSLRPDAGVRIFCSHDRVEWERYAAA